MSGNKTVFFHVGLGKTGSTFLQKEVFPKLNGIQYIRPARYKKSKQIINHSSSEKILVSREFDKQLEDELRWFCEDVENVKVIICLRRQDEWMASQYRRRVKNGWLMSFQEFINLSADEGYWKIDELYYAKKIEWITDITGSQPLVLIYDQLRDFPQQFIDRITNYLGVSLKDHVDYSPRHLAFSDKQLLVLQWFCRTVVKRVPKGRSNKILHWLTYRPVWAFYHIILYGAKLIPSGWISKHLIAPTEMETVSLYYQEDWERVVANSIS